MDIHYHNLDLIYFHLLVNDLLLDQIYLFQMEAILFFYSPLCIYYFQDTKICNYWLYVIWQYTDREYKNIENLTVAPDTHVVKATHRLGLITDEELNRSDVQLMAIDRWNDLFKGTKYKPIVLVPDK